MLTSLLLMTASLRRVLSYGSKFIRVFRPLLHHPGSECHLFPEPHFYLWARMVPELMGLL